MTTHFFGLFLQDRTLPNPLDRAFGRTISRGRFARKSPKHAIELRERLKPCRERDFADAQFRISQEVTGSFEPSARDIIDKIYTSDLLEVFAQIIRIHVDRFRDFGQRKLFA